MAQAVGLVPRRFTNPADALLAMQKDGAAIVEYGRTGPEAAVQATREVLGERLRGFRPPVGIITNPVDGEGPHPDAQRRNVLSDKSVELELHIDAFMQFGTDYPDFIFLLCAAQAPQGGENFAIDGVRLIDRLAEDPTNRELVDFLWGVEINQSSPSGVPHQAPVSSWTRGGRRTARRHWHQQLLTDSDPAQARLLQLWAEHCREAARVAPRFLLKPGDFLCLDNYRVFHGREPYHGLGRVLHRVWAWTDMAFGVPKAVRSDRLAPDNHATREKKE